MAQLSLAAVRAVDFLEALDVTGTRPTVRDRRRFAVLARQVAGSSGVAIRDPDGELVLVMGLWGQDGDRAEAWFAPGPALRANLRAGLRLAREIFDGVGADAAPLTVEVLLHPSGVAGARLAARFGFMARGVAETALGPMQTWERTFMEVPA